MDSISVILDSIKSLSSSIFVFSQLFDVFKLLNSVPDIISNKLLNDDFIYHLEQADSNISWLHKYFENEINPHLKKELKKLKKHNPKDVQIPYADFKVDKPPVFKNVVNEQLNFMDIINSSQKKIVPIRHRAHFSFSGVCPFCGAPKEYIYDNNSRGQYRCKCCRNTFTVKTTPKSESVEMYCPYCGRKLSLHHDRKGYYVYMCTNRKCSYYKSNKESFDKGNTESFLTSSGRFRFHYTYREFKFSLSDLEKACEQAKTRVNLKKIHFDQRVLGLVLTYYINYGLSTRKTALILKDVHGLRISHQTVANYAAAVSAIVKPMVDNYPYKIGNILTGDETYVKVRGKNHYVFFFSDTFRKIITSYDIHDTRDTENACRAIYRCMNFYNKIPEDLTFITDGNPIYNAAQLFFKINGIPFDLHQVIGVKNKDEESRTYRPFKQIEERLNRTYKMNYHGTNGYDRLETANSYMVLWVAFHNFLRRHSALGFKTPVDDNLFDDCSLMTDKWLKMIELSSQYHKA